MNGSSKRPFSKMEGFPADTDSYGVSGDASTRKKKSPGNGWKSSDEQGKCSLPYRLLLPSHSVGFLIGRSGATVREIQSESGATVQFQKENEVQSAVSDKVVTISGDTAAKDTGLRLILEKLTAVTNLQDVEGKDGIVVAVPNKAISLIIGPKGQHIHELCQHSNCEIQVHKEHIYSPVERVVSIRSSEIGNLTSGVSRIYQLLEDCVEKGKLSEMEFISNPFKREMGNFGFGGAPGAEKVNKASLGGSAYGVPSGFSSQPALPPMNSHSSAHPMGRDVAYGMQPVASSQASTAFMGRGGTGQTSNVLLHPLGNQPTKCIVKLLVNTETAGWIVGKSGTHVKKVKNQTGVDIEVGDSPPVETDGVLSTTDRVVQFSGSIANKYNGLKLLIPSMEQKACNNSIALRMLISSKAVSHIIGPRGQVINQLTRLSGADIQVDKQDALEGEKILRIKGTPEVKLMAMLMIMQKLEEFDNFDLCYEGLSIPFDDAGNTMGAPMSSTVGGGATLTAADRMQRPGMVAGALLPAPADQRYPYSDGRGSAGDYYQSNGHSAPFGLRAHDDQESRPECHFINQAQRHTVPRVIASSQQYVLEFFFPRNYIDVLSHKDATGVVPLRDIKERSGCTITVGTDLTTGFSKSLVLTGTPVANALGILLIQEKLMDYEKA